jgi:hypothetical protein
MEYDDDHGRASVANAVCDSCRREFWRDDDDTGYLCDPCCQSRDLADRLREQDARDVLSMQDVRR